MYDQDLYTDKSFSKTFIATGHLTSDAMAIY